MNDSTEVAIVAAMEREVAPLIRDWTMILGHSRRVYEKGGVILIAGGIGPKCASEAADAVLGFRQPSVILSVGLAGALDSALSVGTVVVPTKVLRQDTEQAFTIEGGEGTLLTATTTADASQKREMAARFAAQVVDMEAAGVAEVARRRGVKFAAVKAVSDELDFPLPPLGRFVDAEGRFRTGRFVAHSVMRPRMWPVLSELRRNATRATEALCKVLSQIHSAADVEILLRTRSAKAS